MKEYWVCFLFLVGSFPIFSQSIVVDSTTYTIPDLVTDVLIDSPCAEVSNINWNNCDDGIGYFTNTNPNLPMSAGIVLTTGMLDDVLSPKNYLNSSLNCGMDYDTSSTLFTYIQSLGIDSGLISYQDVTVLEFDFVPFTDTMSFNFIFASEVYGLFQCEYSDAFAFFLTNTVTNVTTNLALVPGTSDPITVLTVRDENTLNAPALTPDGSPCLSVNEQFFGLDNQIDPLSAAINFNGQTVMMVAESIVVPNTLYHIQIIIGDRNLAGRNSAVFIEAGSFNVGTTNIWYELGVGSETDDMLESNGLALCPGECKELNSGLPATGYTFVWTKDGVVLPDETGPSITVCEAGEYCVEATNTGSNLCTQTDCLTVEYLPGFTVNPTPEPIVFCDDGSGSYSYNFNDHITEILGAGNNPADFDVTYYLSATDAQNGYPQIPAVYTATQTATTIYVRVENFSFVCAAFTEFEVLVVDCSVAVTQPNDLMVCNSSGNTATFDLTQQNNTVLNGLNPMDYVVTYYTSQAGADDGTFDLATPFTAYQNTSNSQTIYVRVEELATGYIGTTSFEIIVAPQPFLTSLSGVTPICEGENTTLTFTGTPNAEVTFTDGTNNYMVTLNASGTVDFTTPMLTVDTTFSLVDVTLPATGCSQTLSGSETIVISPTPEITGVTYTTEICEGTLTDIVVNLNNATGYTWVATLANIDATAVNQTGDQTDINQVFNLQNPLIPGYVTIAIQPELVGGNCAGVVETIQITINPVPEITNIVESATEICNNETVHFELSGEPSGLEYQWTAILTGVMTDDGVTSGIITSNELELTLVLVNPNTQGSFYVEFTPVLGSCVGTTVNSEVITVNPIPGSVVASPTIPICSGDTAANAFDIQLGFPLITGTTVEWVVFDSSGVSGATDGSSATTPFEINDVLTATGSSPGYVTYRIWTISPAGCQGGYVDFTVVVNPNPMPVLQGGSICVDGSGATFQSFWLQASGNFTANSEFVWYEASDTTSPIAITTIPQLEIFDIGSYYVEVTNQDTNCMGTSDAVPVVATSPATLVETTVTDYFSDSATVIVTATVDNGYLLYQMDEGGYQDSNVFTGVSSGEHTVEVIDSQGCTYLTTTVMVIDYPKYFTPNGDGYNDTWNITGLNQPGAKLYIFDRYGKLLKQISATDASNGWDGTYNGNQMPSTDYWFSLQYIENNVAKEFKAHFALKR